MYAYLFEITGGKNKGERFFVKCNNLREAWENVDEIFPTDPLRCWGRYSIEDAEMTGLDIYGKKVIKLL